MILDIVSKTDNYNFHSHTPYCDGRAPMAEMAEAAVAAGMTHWGFSPHSPIPIWSSCNMDKAVVGEYLAEVDRLRGEMEGRINLYASMEIDYLGPEFGPASDYFASLPLDYRIGSVHFVPCRPGEWVDVDGNFASFSEKMERHFDNDIRRVVEGFYAQSMAMVEAGGFDIIGHFDKIGHNASQFCPGIEDEPWYQELVHALIDAIVRSGVIAEVNTKALATAGRIFPSARYIPELLRRGVPLVVNSDAHYPDKVDAGRRETIALIRQLKSQVGCR